MVDKHSKLLLEATLANHLKDINIPQQQGGKFQRTVVLHHTTSLRQPYPFFKAASASSAQGLKQHKDREGISYIPLNHTKDVS